MYRKSDSAGKKHIIRYFELLELCKRFNEKNAMNQRNISVIQDIDGSNIVVINDIIFKGKRSVERTDVEKYLRQYVGEFYQIAETGDVVYIGTDLPDEYRASQK